MTDLTPYSVVRDARGHLCLIDDGHVTYMGERLDEIEEARSLPVTPILDRDGLPVVRTVGDLTARHIGKRVRLDEHYDARLETIFFHEGGEVSLNFTHPEGFTYGCSRPLDTPCEVLS